MENRRRDFTMFASNDARKSDRPENTHPRCPKIICQGIFGTLGTPLLNSLPRAGGEINNSSAYVIESGTPVPSVPRSAKTFEDEEDPVEVEERIAIQEEGSLNP